MDNMSNARPLDVLQAEIAAVRQTLGQLARERAAAHSRRRAGIVADFDGGLDRAAIAARWGASYGVVAQILHRAGRTARTRAALGLTARQRADYQWLLAQGVRCTIARAIALRDTPGPS